MASCLSFSSRSHLLSGLTQTSDDRYKSYETELTNATSTLLQLTPKRYEKHTGLLLTEEEEAPDLTGVHHFTEVGFIAQEVAQIPELQFMVDTNPSGVYGLQMNNLIGYLVKGFQELATTNASLEARLAALEAPRRRSTARTAAATGSAGVPAPPAPSPP